MEKWTAPAIASLRGDNTIPLQRTFASLTEYLLSLSDALLVGNVPAGGTAGQVLSKIDAIDYNTQWIGLAASATTDTTNASNITSGTLLSARLSGSYTGITGVGTVTTGTWSGSFGAVSGANLTTLNASNLSSGTVASARIGGSYAGITAVGTLSGLTSSGTISGQVITGDDVYSPSISLKGWSGDGGWASVESNRGYLLLGHPSNTGGIYLRSNSTSTPVYIGANQQNTLAVGYYSPYGTYSVTIDGVAFCNNWWRSTGNSGWYNETYGGGIWMSDSTWIRTYNSKRFLADSGLNVGGTAVTSEALVVTGNGRVTDSFFFTNFLVADDGVASSGQAAQWLGAFGNWYLVRNSSTLRDKENIQPLGSVLTAEMVDGIDVKLWSRKNADGIPEVGPMAEEMDAVSPFLSVRAMDLDKDGNVVATGPEGINQNGWLSLLTIALQDCRRRIAELESR